MDVDADGHETRSFSNDEYSAANDGRSILDYSN